MVYPANSFKKGKTMFIVKSKMSKIDSNTVVAPTGYARKKDGSIIRDNTPSPEMGHIKDAYRFKTRRSAARTASKLSDPIIIEINY